MAALQIVLFHLYHLNENSSVGEFRVSDLPRLFVPMVAGDRDREAIVAAKESIEEAKRLSKCDYTWAYSRAFLIAYEGDLSEAYHTYKLAFNNQTWKTTHIECEVFIRRILEIEPNKIQLWYCLGLIYLFAHEDFVLSRESFEQFKQLDKKKQRFVDQIKYVDRYLKRIDAEGGPQ